MVRSTKYTLKYLTKRKQDLLTQLFDIYKAYLVKTIDLMWDGKVPIRHTISSKQIDWMNNLGGQYKHLIYKHASEIVRSTKFKKGKKSKPEIKNISISFDNRMVKIEKSNNSFDKWIRLKLPFIVPNKKRKRIEILIPIKEHKHSLKFKDWKLSNTIMLKKYCVICFFKKENPPIKQEGKILGIDLGYKNLIATSDGKFIGKDFNKIYEKITRKKRGSKAYKRALIERNNKINEIINKELDLSNVKILKVENLKKLKQGIKGKFRKEFNNKFQYWIYRQVLAKLERKSCEEAVQFVRVSPTYTSQTCPMCQFVHKNNRKGDIFKCINCGYENHADVVGAINIARQEFIVPVAQKLEFIDRNKYL